MVTNVLLASCTLPFTLMFDCNRDCMHMVEVSRRTLCTAVQFVSYNYLLYAGAPAPIRQTRQMTYHFFGWYGTQCILPYVPLVRPSNNYFPINLILKAVSRRNEIMFTVSLFWHYLQNNIVQRQFLK